MRSSLGTATVLRANSRTLPIADNTVDLIVTSPPYFALRSYTDDGEHYAGQIGDEPTPQEFLDSLIEVTRECVRVLKPSGSMWINLGDKYSDRAGPAWAGSSDRLTGRPEKPRRASSTSMAPRKSLLGLPWRYAIRCVDELGLILRSEVVWSKPNGLPESVTDRVRRSHEQWFHFTIAPRYFSAVDEIREPHTWTPSPGWSGPAVREVGGLPAHRFAGEIQNPLGKLPGSVWVVPTEPLDVPDRVAHAKCCAGVKRMGCEDGIDHFAAFPTEWPKRIIAGWSPAGVCTACGEGRRPVTSIENVPNRKAGQTGRPAKQDLRGPRSAGTGHNNAGYPHTIRSTTITGYQCACQDASAPVRPAVVLDPFGGTGTTAMVAKALGRDGVTVDMSADYCRLAAWRTTDRDQLAKVLGVAKAVQQPADQLSMFDLLAGA